MQNKPCHIVNHPDTRYPPSDSIQFICILNNFIAKSVNIQVKSKVQDDSQNLRTYGMDMVYDEQNEVILFCSAFKQLFKLYKFLLFR